MDVVIFAIIEGMPQTSDDGQSKAQKALPTGEQLYDALMILIEPELISANIPLLEEKYKNESPVERAARMQKYQKAMEEYDKRYSALIAALNADVAKMKRDGIAAIEKKSATKEVSVLSNIESAILSS